MQECLLSLLRLAKTGAESRPSVFALGLDVNGHVMPDASRELPVLCLRRWGLAGLQGVCCCKHCLLGRRHGQGTSMDLYGLLKYKEQGGGTLCSAMVCSTAFVTGMRVSVPRYLRSYLLRQDCARTCARTAHLQIQIHGYYCITVPLSLRPTLANKTSRLT
jgi:hypothetical protein